MIQVKNVVLIGGFEQKSKAMRQAMLMAMLDAARLWHKEMLPRHFQPAAMQRYGYKRRSEKYLTRKSRKGRSEPLVWTGATRETATRLGVITGSPRGGKVVAKAQFVVPGYIRLRRRHGPDMRAELLAVHPQEQERLGKFIEERFTKHLAAASRREHVRV